MEVKMYDVYYTRKEEAIKELTECYPLLLMSAGLLFIMGVSTIFIANSVFRLCIPVVVIVCGLSTYSHYKQVKDELEYASECPDVKRCVIISAPKNGRVLIDGRSRKYTYECVTDVVVDLLTEVVKLPKEMESSV